MILIALTIIIFGFIYGSDYFAFYDKYRKKNCIFSEKSYTILSIKWWNIKFNWYTLNWKWYIDISVILPVNIIKKVCFREYFLIITSAGVRTCVVDIDTKQK